MKKFFAIFAVIIAAALLCRPAVVFIYKIKEPSFIAPVGLSEPGKIPIRRDDYGDGEFGAKRKGGRLHKGLDIKAPVGSPVYASKSGWATCKSLPSGYGKLIVIYHVDGFQTRYGHLFEFSIRPGQWVNQGRAIGLVGKTGNAGHRRILPHLHFEIRDPKDVALDPAETLKK